jgi:hypothetical protein
MSVTREAPLAAWQEVGGSPPRSEEAEQATLGAMLLERDAIARVVSMLDPGDFYTDVHRNIFNAILDLFNEGQGVDVVTLAEHLRVRDMLDRLGGQAYLAHLLDAVPTAASAERYANIVRDKARLRQVQALAHRALEQSANGGRSLEVIASLRSALDDLAEADAVDTFAVMRCADFLAAELVAPLWVCEPLAPGGGLTFLFSRAGLGKSLFAFELARCIATGEPFLGRFKTTSGPTIYCNLEMAPPQFQHRLRLFELHHPVGQAALHVVNESLALNDAACFARFKALCENIAPALVVIDPLIRALPGVKLNLAEEVGPALAPAADLARELGFGLLCIHHSRKDGGAGGLDSLADSRDFAARADVALLMQAMGEDGGDGGLLRVTCVKQRWGEATPPFCLRLENDAEGYPTLLPAEAPNAKNEVLEVLAMQSPLATGAIVAELEGVKSRQQVNRALKDLLEAGRIRQVRRGLWALPETSENGGGDR